MARSNRQSCLYRSVLNFHRTASPRALCVHLFVLLALLHSQYAMAQHNFPPTAEACFKLGEELLEDSKADASIAVFTECLRLNPHFADAYYSRGLAHERRNEWQDALVDYTIYLDLKPDHVEVLLTRAHIRYRLQLYALAKEDFSHLLHLPKGETTTIFFRQPSFGSGVDQLFTTQGSNKAYLFNWLGLTDTQLSNFKDAIVHFDSALRLNPTDADLYVNRGIAHQRNNNRAKAQQDFEKALRLNPNHSTANYNLHLLGLAGAKLNLLDSAIAANPMLPYSYALRAYEKMEAGRYAEALKDYDQAIRLDATQVEYFLNRGLLHERLQHYTQAYNDYSSALALDETFEKAWLNRGNVLMRQRKFKEAVEDYTSALAFNKEYPAAYYNRALAYQKMQLLSAACEDLRTTKKLGMKIPSALLTQVCDRQPE